MKIPTPKDSVNLPEIFAIQNPEWLGMYPPELLEDFAYHQAPGVSKSSMDLVHKSIDHWLNREWQETRSLLFGAAVHAGVLQPTEFKNKVKHSRLDTRSGAWKLEKENAERDNAILLKEDDYQQALTAIRRVWEHPAANELFAIGGQAEQSYFIEDPDTGVLKKCRCDFIYPEERLIVDLKTTRSAEPDSFSSSCTKFRYDVQQAWYIDTVAHYYNTFPEEWTFKFCAVENTPPFNVAVYSIHPDDVDAGRRMYQDDLNRLVEFYEQRGLYTGYADTDRERVIRIRRRFNGFE